MFIVEQVKKIYTLFVRHIDNHSTTPPPLSRAKFVISAESCIDVCNVFHYDSNDLFTHASTHICALINIRLLSLFML